MTRNMAFGLLKAADIVQAEVKFAGGNDEGTIESITLHKKDGTNTIIDYTYNNRDPLHEELSKPVWEKYGSFAGNFEVYGSIIWDVETGTISMNGQESCTTWSTIEEEIESIDTTETDNLLIALKQARELNLDGNELIAHINKAKGAKS